MGIRLRKMTMSLEKTKFSDNKPTGGVKRLSDEVILSIQKYYDFASGETQILMQTR